MLYYIFCWFVAHVSVLYKCICVCVRPTRILRIFINVTFHGAMVGVVTFVNVYFNRFTNLLELDKNPDNMGFLFDSGAA